MSNLLMTFTRSLFLLAALASFCSEATAQGPINYDLVPMSFTVGPSYPQYSGTYSVSGYVQTDGSFGLLGSDVNILDAYIYVRGPVNHDIQLGGFSGLFEIGGIATPNALSFQPFDSSDFGNRVEIFIPASFDCPWCNILSMGFGPANDGSDDIRVGHSLISNESFNVVADSAGSPVIPASNGIYAINSGVIPGSSPTTPIFPSSTRQPAGCNCIAFNFNNAPTRTWIDPPVTEGYEYRMQDGSDALFTSILDFPAGFDEPFTVIVDGVTLGDFGPGEPVDFVSLLGNGVVAFTVTGITPGVDAEDPQAFPIKLEFNQQFASFTMTSIAAIPEPTAFVMATALAWSVLARRRSV